MALQPQDLQKPIEEELKKIDQLEKDIDADMKKKYEGIGVHNFSPSLHVNQRMLDELRRRYHGWKLKLNQCQKDGEWITFTPLPPPSTHNDWCDR